MKVSGLILGLLLPWFAQAQQPYYGTRLDTLSLSGSESQADIQALPIKPGDILSPENVRAAIEALYQTGRYSYVEVDATRAPDGGAALTFHVRPNFFFSTIRLDPENLLERSLSGYLRMPFGEKLSTSVVDRLVQDTTELLKSEGYFQANVTAAYDFDEEAHLVFVTLNATSGARAKVGHVNLHGGEETFPHMELASTFDLKPGYDFSTTKLDKAISDIRSKFVELRFVNTRINVSQEHKSATNTVDLDVAVQPGQFVLVQTKGFDISRKKLRELVPVFEEGAVDPDLIEEGRVQIGRYMQQEGYFDAMVTADSITVDPTLGNAIQIIYTIAPGTKHEIGDVRIEGNQYFTVEEIRRRMKTRKGELLNRGMFSADILEEDRRTIEAIYRNAGFEGTVVTATPEDVGHVITVVVRIQEGRQLPIDLVTITGNRQISDTELRAVLRLKEGDTYTASAVDQDRAALTQLYYSHGFAEARVERMAEQVASGDGVRISFEITEGQPSRLGSILVAGNTITKDKVIRRNSRLEPYTPYDPEAILEAQQRLYATGLFSRVEIVTLDQGQSGTRNVLIQVEDAKPILLTYGVGYQEWEHARGTFEVSHNNLFGLNRGISVRLRGSSRERLAQATYKEPRFFNHEIDGFVSAFVEHSERPSYTASRNDFSIQTLKAFTPQRNFLITAGYQTVDLVDIRVNPHANTLSAERGIIQIARIGTTFINDRRDDPLNPTTGTFSTTTFQVASRAYGSEINFTSLYNQYSVYTPLQSGVFASSLRFGWNQPFGMTKNTGLPPTERYFAGGSTTLRGFGFDKVQPLGGNVMAIANLEYRVPLRGLPLEGLGGAAFYDTGNVYPRIGDVHLSNLTHTVGFGFRYQTPLGPVRLDVGINLKPDVNGFEEKRVHVFFTLGNPF
jgi:outer membrane protein insertion porin family